MFFCCQEGEINCSSAGVDGQVVGAAHVSDSPASKVVEGSVAVADRLSDPFVHALPGAIGCSVGVSCVRSGVRDLRIRWYHFLDLDLNTLEDSLPCILVINGYS